MAIYVITMSKSVKNVKFDDWVKITKKLSGEFDGVDDDDDKVWSLKGSKKPTTKDVNNAFGSVGIINTCIGVKAQ
jgi:hypothetical protein